MFRDCRLAHRKRPGEFLYRRLACGEAYENTAPSWVSESCEREIYLAWRAHCITIWLHNHTVIHVPAPKVKFHFGINHTTPRTDFRQMALGKQLVFVRFDRFGLYTMLSVFDLKPLGPEHLWRIIQLEWL